MFAALRQWTEFVNAMSGWKIVEAAIDRANPQRCGGGGGGLRRGAQPDRPGEEAVAKCYGLSHVKLNCLADAPAQPEPPKPGPQPASGLEQPAQSAPSAPAHEEIQTPQDAFARAEAIRARPALKQVRQAAPGAKKKAAGKGEKRDNGKAIFGKPIKRAPAPIGELELDMGMVVIEGDVFAVDNRELKKRGAWVVAFDITDYTGSIRVNKFFPGDEGKALVDGVRKGMHLLVQGRLNMDRFYGDMVLEPVAVMAAEKKMKMDNAPEKRVELHLHTTMSAMDALTAVGPKLGPDKNVVKRAEAWGPQGHRHHRPRGGPVLPGRVALRQKHQAPVRGGGLLPQRRGRPGGGPRGDQSALRRRDRLL